eukprot:468579-Hanusia_phi.AAC.1
MATLQPPLPPYPRLPTHLGGNRGVGGLKVSVLCSLRVRPTGIIPVGPRVPDFEVKPETEIQA